MTKKTTGNITEKQTVLTSKLTNGLKTYEIIDFYDLSYPHSSAQILKQKNEKRKTEIEEKINGEIETKTEPESENLLYRIIEPVLSSEKQLLFDKIISLLNDSINPNLFENKNKSKTELLKKSFFEILKIYSIRLSEKDAAEMFYFIERNFLKFCEISPLLDDKNIEDISCNGYDLPIYVFHQKYGSVKTTLSFSKPQLDLLVRRMAQSSKKHISVSNPMTDATMPDGSRVHLTLGNEITVKGSTFTIRKFNEKPFLPADLVSNKTFTAEMMAYLWLCVESNMNIIFAGGTASGKTTSLNAVCHFIPRHKKIVSIEDTREINLPHENWVSGISRAGSEAADEIMNSNSFSNYSKKLTLYDLLKAALRQRPEYILVGEIRGSEAYVLFQAMSTGHTTLSTMHAESVDTLIHRLENPPMNVPRVMIQTLDVLVVLAQTEENGHFYKKCLSVHEIIETDPQTSEILTQDIFNKQRAQSIDLFSNSVVLKRIQERKGWAKDELRREFEKRIRFLINEQKGEKENGEKENEEKENGEKENGEKENGEKENGEKENGEKGKKEKEMKIYDI
ncbi:MAG: type II/IV secretion system ATPase subunit [Methanimicrococcus sp.]|nr:type II/IV secretion system ATPase subunit [Methanimicrococcus sp.]